jgi:hypothetical protein
METEADDDTGAVGGASLSVRSAAGEPSAKRATTGAVDAKSALRDFELEASLKSSAEWRDKYEALCLRTHTGAPTVLPRREALPVCLSAAFRSHNVQMVQPLQQMICDYSNPDLDASTVVALEHHDDDLPANWSREVIGLCCDDERRCLFVAFATVETGRPLTPGAAVTAYDYNSDARSIRSRADFWMDLQFDRTRGLRQTALMALASGWLMVIAKGPAVEAPGRSLLLCDIRACLCPEGQGPELENSVLSGSARIDGLWRSAGCRRDG